MKIISQFLITLSGKSGNAFQALQRATESEGWAYAGSQDYFGDELRLYQSKSTPLALGLLTSPGTPGRYAILFGQSWLRCTVAGGWAKIGFFPDDVAQRIINKLAKQGWSVADSAAGSRDDGGEEDDDEDAFDDDDDDVDDDDDDDDDDDYDDEDDDD